MSLTDEEITILLEDSRALFVRRRIGKIYHVEPHEIFLSFRVDKQKIFLFLTTRNSASRFHPLWKVPEFPKRPSVFCLKLRKFLSGKILSEIVKIPGNRAVRLNLEDCNYSLVGEFFGARGNIILLNKDRIAGSLWPIRRGSVTERSGHVYRLAPGKFHLISRQHPRYLPREVNEEFSFSRAFGREMKQKEHELDFNLKSNEVKTLLKKERKRKERLLQKLDVQMREAGNAEKYRRMGEAIKCSLHLIRKGSDSIVLNDPFLPENVLDIPLDPMKTAQENLEDYFRKYKKLKKSAKIIEVRYKKCAEEISCLNTDSESLENLSFVHAQAFETLSELAEKYHPKKSKKKKGPKKIVAKGARHFELSGHLIWIGRNAKNNSELFRYVAKGNDYFMHVIDKPGSVAIVRPPPGKEASQEVLIDVAILAVYYSCRRESGSHDVDYTKVKFVKPIKEKPGRFALSSRHFLHVSVGEDRLSLIKNKLKSI